MSVVKDRVCSWFARPAESFQLCGEMFGGKRGVEIGGPSRLFSKNGIFPVYPIVAQLDNCNFGNRTVWEGDIEPGLTFKFSPDKPKGRQYIAEATAMGCMASEAYDFVISSHVLEHTANPILALSEWLRLLKDHGSLAMILPHKDGTFDHRCPVTTLEHLIADFNAGAAENDLTHMPEIMALHDLERDAEAGDLVAFKARSLLNFDNRCFHHHVFDTQLAVSLVDYMGVKICAVETIQPMHIVIIAKKMKTGEQPDNAAFMCESAQFHNASPFPSDRGRLNVSSKKSQ